MKLVQMKCQNCNENLELDLDHLTAFCPYCGSKLLIDADKIGDLLIAREETKQKLLDREVACKILLPELASSPEYLSRFLQEARLVARLDHPNIVQALDAGSTSDGFSYFIMEYVPGKSLEDIRVSEPERLTPDFLLGIFTALADALDYAWKSHGITHGDIKPGNLLIRDGDNMLKLADLGLAKIGGAASGEDVMATPLYVAPEVIWGTDSGPAADIYSFGVMCYELLAGKPPFDGDIDEVIEHHKFSVPQPLFVANPDIDRELSDFIASMLEKEPSQRPADWGQIRDFLAGYRARSRADTRSDARTLRLLQKAAERHLPESPGSARGGKWLQIAAAALALAALIALVVLFVSISSI